MKKLSAIFLAVGAALSTSAFAERVVHYSYAFDPVTGTYIEKQTVYYDDPAPAVTYVQPSTVTYAEPSTVTYVEPNRVAYVEPPIVVTAPYNEDRAITYDVMDRIASDDSIHGRVGVDTYQNVVTLSGRVNTPWQAEKAQTHAMNTPGVREVNNELRARIGG